MEHAGRILSEPSNGTRRLQNVSLNCDYKNIFGLFSASFVYEIFT